MESSDQKGNAQFKKLEHVLIEKSSNFSGMCTYEHVQSLMRSSNADWRAEGNQRGEYRVGLTPEAVREFVAAGMSSAWKPARAPDQCHGSSLSFGRCYNCQHAAEIFAKSEMIIKVKEPQESEWTRLREGQILFAFLHLAADLAQAKGLLAPAAPPLPMKP